MTPISAQDLLALGLPEQLWLVFVAGILTSLTPCVYPLIPVTIAIFAGQGHSNRTKSFVLSLIYVLGIATTYTLLGLFSALSGDLFGKFLGSPWVSLALGVLMTYLALSSLDIFRFNFGSFLTNRAGSVKQTGMSGAFLVGMLSGVVAAPCTGPILATILLVAGASGDPSRGALLLFVHAIGIGLLFMALGAFRGLTKLLPRSGPWLNFIKYLLSLLILLVGWMFLQPFIKYLGISTSIFPLIFVPTIAILSALIVGLIGLGQDIRWMKTFSVLSVSIVVFWGFNLGSEGTKVEITDQQGAIKWIASLEAGMNQALELNKVAIIDLYADWCGACKEFETITFSDPRVADLISQKFIPIKIDFTFPDDSTDQIEKDFNVLGLPTILFLNPDGSEIPDSRITGFLNNDEFLKHIGKFIPQ